MHSFEAKINSFFPFILFLFPWCIANMTDCKLKLTRSKVKRNGKRLLVFKRTGTCKNVLTRQARLPCGEDDCKVCGPFLSK